MIWDNGVYFIPEGYRTAIVVIHRLPSTAETLWLRILGKGKVQQQAIDELEALSSRTLVKFTIEIRQESG